MQNQPVYNSGQVLDQITLSEENGLLTNEVRNQWSKETERKVEEYDLDKRQQSAVAIQEINKLVITA